MEDDELYVIEAQVSDGKEGGKSGGKEEKPTWVFVGAFTKSDSANRYFKNHYGPNTTATIVPRAIPGDYNTYFDQFKYCSDCTKLRLHFVHEGAYLVQRSHAREGDLYAWHFDCLLPDAAAAKNYINSRELYRSIPVCLPCHRDRFFNYLADERVRRQRTAEIEEERAVLMGELIGFDSRIILANLFVTVMLLIIVIFFK